MAFGNKKPTLREVGFAGRVADQSEKAVKFDGGPGGMVLWVPKSQLGRLWYADQTTPTKAIRIGYSVAAIEVSEFIARERGL